MTECPICGYTGAVPAEHDQEKHLAAKAKYAGRVIVEPRVRPVPIKDRSLERADSRLVDALINARPDLAKEIIENYELGLRGQQLPPDNVPQPDVVQEDLGLRPARRTFGYASDE
jgi:hypothetical protein